MKNKATLRPRPKDALEKLVRKIERDKGTKSSRDGMARFGIKLCLDEIQRARNTADMSPQFGNLREELQKLRGRMNLQSDLEAKLGDFKIRVENVCNDIANRMRQLEANMSLIGGVPVPQEHLDCKTRWWRWPWRA